MPAISDASARSQALDISQSFLVQAPAGSGKTELLIQRYLALLASVAEPEAVVAITFTRKAAGEMRSRVLKAMDEAAEGTPVREEHARITRQLATAVLERDRACEWNLQQLPSRLRIQTIDSLCSSIAHSMPAVSGFGGMPDIAENPDELYAAAAHNTILLLAESSAESDAVATLLRHLDNDVSSTEKLIADMLRKRDQWLRQLGHGADLASVRRNLDDTLERIVCRSLKRVRGVVPASLAGEIVELARFGAAQAVNAARPIHRCLNLASLPGTAAAELEQWLGIADLLLTADGAWRKSSGINKRIGFDSGLPERTHLRQLLESLAESDELLAALVNLRELPPARIDDRQWPIIAALFMLLPRAVGELKLLFASSGKVDFAEVAQAASLALGTREEPTDLGLALGCQIEHLLVDEYQDTSVTQQDLLEKLTATWETGDSHTLFLVGDPMQSIYRFRQAEVGLFIEAAQTRQIGTVQLQPLVLKTNFRSQQGIVDWVNDTFREVFPPLDDIGRGAVSYAQSDAFHPTATLAAVKVYPFIGKDFAQQESDRILELIQETCARDPRATIAVLVRARTHLAKLVPLLREKGLHFRAVEIDSLAERQAIIDLVSLTCALLHLGDRIAWLSILRAPWCGLDLQDLYLLCAKDTSSCVWELLHSRIAQLSADGQQRTARLCDVVGRALENRERQPLAQLVRGVWLSLGGPACISNGDMEDVSTFFELLEGLEADGELPGAHQLQERLGALFAHPDPEADDSLQLMTIHKAKGLEFDTVIVPGLGRRSRGDDAQLLLWMERASEDGEPELLVAPIKRKGGDEDPLYRFIRKIEYGRGCEEDRRMLYVAATRARTQLHLLGHAELMSNGELKPDPGSLLRYLWPVVQGEFVRAHAAQEAVPQNLELAAAAEEKPAQLLKRLPREWTAPACPEAIKGAAISAVTGELVTFDWASDTARHIGTVTHALLHRIAKDGLERWDLSTVNGQTGAIRTALLECGVTQPELEDAVERVQRALQKTLQDLRGRWLLDRHAKAQSEYAITGVIDGQVRHFKVDRTFVDESGVRWVVDYKTGVREGAGREAFPDAEVLRYREQLETYAQVLAIFDPRPIRLGLYFPMLGEWREWQLASAAGG
jgi:ATP-dependent exoDNAse (exonuclease V) beta subunit